MIQNITELKAKLEAFIESEPGRTTDDTFTTLALEIFRFQAVTCPPYSKYIELLEIDTDKITRIEEIPFLPVRLFKNQKVYSLELPHETIFTSSATTGMIPSSHYVADLSLYKLSFSRSFNLFYGNPESFNILALLPSYLEREGSSLIFMTEHLIKGSRSKESGFYLYDHQKLAQTLKNLRDSEKRTILLGVSFALVDFSNNYQINFPELIVMETGGMKGRGVEMSREEIHKVIKHSFGVNSVHSEYGMAELLSQAYSDGEGLFRTPHWMKFLLRDFTNPLKINDKAETGGLNIIDLANIFSCSFIETEDIGIKTAGNLWKITGRIQNSEIRGCNLLLG